MPRFSNWPWPRPGPFSSYAVEVSGWAIEDMDIVARLSENTMGANGKKLSLETTIIGAIMELVLPVFQRPSYIGTIIGLGLPALRGFHVGHLWSLLSHLAYPIPTTNRNLWVISLVDGQHQIMFMFIIVTSCHMFIIKHLPAMISGINTYADHQPPDPSPTSPNPNYQAFGNSHFGLHHLHIHMFGAYTIHQRTWYLHSLGG